MKTVARSLLLSLCLLAGTAATAEESRPNILFLLADDLGWADTTLFGRTAFYETPNLERLAARGMTFSSAHTASPLCSPTRSSILTGLHPARTGLTAPNCHRPEVVLRATAADRAAPDRKLTACQSVTRLDPKYETLGERFHAEGYATAHFGKWHLGAEPWSPLENGFDVDVPHWHGPGPAGSYVAPWRFPNFKEKTPHEHIEDRLGDEVVAFLESRRNRPFFVNYWQFSVHAPFDARADLIEKYRGRVNPDDQQRSPTYAAMVQSMDENVGKVLDAIDRLGLADRTIIVFFSDNGGNMYNEIDGTTPTANRPLRGGKGTTWEGGVRVPAVVVWPGVVEPGSRSEAFITSTDFYPTLLEMAGLPPSDGQTFDGRSFVPALKGKPFDRDAIFTWFPHSPGVPDTLPPSAAIYQGDWKLFRFFHDAAGGAHRHALYNLRDDIGERTDLAASEPERVAAMAAKLDAFVEETAAVFPKYNPDYDPALKTLAQSGWRATKGCALALRDGILEVTATEPNAHVTLALKDPAATGALALRLTFKSATPGRIDLRWSEEAVTPQFFRERLVRSGGYRGGEWQPVEMPFTAKKPVTSFRIDFMAPPGVIALREVELLRDGTVERRWDFSAADGD